MYKYLTELIVEYFPLSSFTIQFIVLAYTQGQRDC